MIRLVDLTLAELVVPADPDALPDSGVDAGVLPRDMVDHLKVAKVFPVAPTVMGAKLPLRVVGGGRCVWAAAAVGWDGPIRCVVRGAAAPGLRTITLHEAWVDGPADLVHSAAFEGQLTEEMHADVVARMTALADRMSAAGIKGFSRVCDVRWARPDLLHLVTPNGAADAATLGRELWALFSGLADDGVALRAWDGRRLL